MKTDQEILDQVKTKGGYVKLNKEEKERYKELKETVEKIVKEVKEVETKEAPVQPKKEIKQEEKRPSEQINDIIKTMWGNTHFRNAHEGIMIYLDQQAGFDVKINKKF